MKPEENGSGRTCETPGCDKEARLQCPTCIKLQIQVNFYYELLGLKLQIDCICSSSLVLINSFLQGSFFCSQECFTGSWDLHKALHKLAKGGNPSSCSKPNRSYNPW